VFFDPDFLYLSQTRYELGFEFMSKLAALIVGLISFSGGAYASSCIPNSINFDVCAEARKMQAGMASHLPMKMNQNMTLLSVIAIEKRVAMTVVWNMSNGELEQTLKISNMTRSDLVEKMRGQTKTMVCSGEKSPTAAFVRLGGEIQYMYRTQDGFPIVEALVNDCPR
jgi:hypothetical protein